MPLQTATPASGVTVNVNVPNATVDVQQPAHPAPRRRPTRIVSIEVGLFHRRLSYPNQEEMMEIDEEGFEVGEDEDWPGETKDGDEAPRLVKHTKDNSGSVMVTGKRESYGWMMDCVMERFFSTTNMSHTTTPTPFLFGLALTDKQLRILSNHFVTPETVNDRFGGDAIWALDWYCVYHYLYIIEVLPSLDGNPPQPSGYENFLAELWKQLGYPPEWEDLTLVMQKWPSFRGVPEPEWLIPRMLRTMEIREREEIPFTFNCPEVKAGDIDDSRADERKEQGLTLI
ncbi:hypothetical protein K435DRAFT_928224 [Dendrothele bispora CBS 962.96]|uniref:Uncharacterized protein n=1 Tax=Dendrothele bispora (strain CBS 962.96) TaxID=1314807 RepID=A0A4S8L6Z7_DENBC|nr:hypothetical protein K435DRAFT_928224 [Dendrothele bispora CBS 962.96]